MNTAGEENLFRKKHTTTIALIVALLLFLCPFVELRCNGFTVAQNSGIGLATGGDFKLSSDMQKKRDEINNDLGVRKEGPSKGSGKFYWLALVSLLLGVAGVGLSFINARLEIVSVAVSALAGLLLIVLMFEINNDFSTKAKLTGTAFFDDEKISIGFTPWYYLSIVAFLAAAFFSFKRGQLLASEGPPSRAPQLDLENPGEQSEFPKSASESEIG